MSNEAEDRPDDQRAVGTARKPPPPPPPKRARPRRSSSSSDETSGRRRRSRRGACAAARPTDRCPAIVRRRLGAVAAEPLLLGPRVPWCRRTGRGRGCPTPEKCSSAPNIGSAAHEKQWQARRVLPMSRAMAHPVDPLTDLPHDERIRSRKLSRRRCDDHRRCDRAERRRTADARSASCASGARAFPG